jgi:23S rRNA pseudouridine2605 synthase
MERDAEPRRIGLARALSKLGYCSRSQADILIREGRVRLNGATRSDPETPVHLERDRIEVNHNPIAAKAKIYLMMNKPRGTITTASDEKGRQTVYSLLRPDWPWVGPVGRLDKASEGLLLFTNDSEWAAKISDPASHVDKTYHVQVHTIADETLTEKLQRGISVNGELLRAKQARVLRTAEKNSWLEIVLDEGKNRQIRRMFEHLGIEVLRLIRVAIGPLILGSLPKGKSRALTMAERATLSQSAESFCVQVRIPKMNKPKTGRRKTTTQSSHVGPAGGSQGWQ